MIGFVSGTIDHIAPDYVVIDTGDFGVNVNISGDTASKLPGIGEHIKLYTYTSVREDAFQLFGFLSRGDLEMFKRLITVNGIGPKGGLAILSVMDADSLRFAIMSGDAKAIAKAPGVGAKTAERVILDLKDKIKLDADLIQREIDEKDGHGSNTYAETPEKSEAIEALVSLGYGRAESMKAVNSVKDADALDSGALLKQALKYIF